MNKILIVRNIIQTAFLALFCLLWENKHNRLTK